MRTRDDALVYQETQSSDKTSKTWDLKYKDPLSALYLEFEATNEATSNKGNYISDIITKVEIVEGSKPLYSLAQHELEALYFYKTKKAPVLFPSEWGGGKQRHGVYLLFGRNLWDAQYAFNCAAYKNPQLKITWDLAAIRALGSAISFATGTLKISAIAKIMEEIAAPANFLSAREVDTFTMVTSGSHPTEMYVDYPWRLMMLRSYLQGSDIDECIDHITLNCDAGKFKPLDDRYIKQLDAEALQMFGMVELKHDVFASDSDTVRLLVNKEPNLAFHNWETPMDLICNLHWAWSSQFAPSLVDDGGAVYGTDVKLSVLERGHALHATVPIPFGDMDKPETWFDATQYTRIDLSSYAPSTGAAGVSSVVLEQVRPNGQ